jgi:polyhydroxyalkanoate synthase
MINRSYIMDLLPQQSFARWMAREGFDVFLLDWGNPAGDGGVQSVDAAVFECIVPAMRAVEKIRSDLIALGYCMGGTLLAATVAREPGLARGCVFLAAPWDFHAGDRAVAEQVWLGTASAEAIVADKGYLPADWIQSIFAAVNADRATQKFRRFHTMDQDSEQARVFVAVEDWLNDGIDLPGPLALSCIKEWYGDNIAATGKWILGNFPVDLSMISVPCLAVVSEQDRLVPLQSSLSMAQKIPSCEVLSVSKGHIGMMTGKNSDAKVWKPVSDWIKNLG